jgi:hypothetical protein
MSCRAPSGTTPPIKMTCKNSFVGNDVWQNPTKKAPDLSPGLFLKHLGCFLPLSYLTDFQSQ